MAKTVQKNFRMSPEAIKLMRDIAKRNDITETDVVEACIARYAAELDIEVGRAKTLLLKQLTKAISASDTDA